MYINWQKIKFDLFLNYIVMAIIINILIYRNIQYTFEHVEFSSDARTTTL